MPDINMAWVFDEPDRFITMSACENTAYSVDLNNNNGRWNVSNIHWYWRNASWWYGRKDAQWTAHSIADRPDRYVYPIGAFSAPGWWAGQPGNELGFPSLFDLIPGEVLQDMRENRALLLIDNLNEGFHEPWLWQFMHDECDRLSIPPTGIVWLSSNEREAAAYAQWHERSRHDTMLQVIGFCHLMYQQRLAFQHRAGTTWTEHMARKSSADVRLYNCLNRVQRPHREYLVLRLIQDDLFRLGIVSHDTMRYGWDDSDIRPATISRALRLLPAVVDDSNFANNKAMTINHQIYLDSWLTVITETHANDDPNQMFISEKVWKPIYCRHPFLILGNRQSQRAMEDMGYRCDFLGSSSWDDEDYHTRIDRIIDCLKALRRESDKLGWFQSLEEQCEHNHEVFMRKDFFQSDACDAILRAYKALS